MVPKHYVPKYLSSLRNFPQKGATMDILLHREVYKNENDLAAQVPL